MYSLSMVLHFAISYGGKSSLMSELILSRCSGLRKEKVGVCGPWKICLRGPLFVNMLGRF